MATCPGKLHNNTTHAGQVLRCSKCMSVGCRDQRCTNFNFDGSGRCQSCGAYSTYKTL